MSIHINARADTSYLFSSLGSNISNVASSDFLGQYASIKNGSYYKLMKAYYGTNTSSSVKSLAENTVNKNKKSQTLTSEEAKAVTNVQSKTDALKESADALLTKGSKSVFNMKDITMKDENGVETTTKGYDTDAIYSAVNQFVTDYNAVMDAVGKVDSDSIQRRTDTMTNATVQNLKLLNSVGITIDTDGKLAVDKDTFSGSDMTTVKSLFQGTGSYGYQVSAQASLINFSADQLASRANTYTGAGTYNSTYNSGLLYNSYF